MSTLHSTHFLLRTTPAEKAELRVAVSKKISKKAVIRNTIRRRVKAVVLPLLLTLPKETYLFSAKSGAESVKGQALKDELALLLKKG